MLPQPNSNPFWSYYEEQPNGCWEWQGPRSGKGYGYYHRVGAHRISYTLAIGPIPNGLVIHHQCDNPPCINPTHLVATTQYDNVHQGLLGDGFHAGEGNPSAKLTNDQAREILDLYSTGHYQQKDLASIYNVSRATICMLVNGQTWKHLQPENDNRTNDND